MALFKKRKGADEPVAPPSPAESIEAMRRRARHRLIGAVVLVLAAVIGFPLLFDTQPRPVAVDIPIEIPDRNKVPPLQPSAVVSAGRVTPAVPATAPAAPAASVPAAPPAAATPVEPAPRAAPAPEPKAEPVEKAARPEPEKKPEPQPDVKAAADEAAKARALLEGRTVSTAAAGTRYVVQVGAFGEREKARQAQLKLERAGLKNYTNVADTRDGKRIRVRAGPFASRAEADQAAEKIKGLDLPAVILTL